MSMSGSEETQTVYKVKSGCECRPKVVLGPCGHQEVGKFLAGEKGQRDREGTEEADTQPWIHGHLGS